MLLLMTADGLVAPVFSRHDQSPVLRRWLLSCRVPSGAFRASNAVISLSPSFGQLAASRGYPIISVTKAHASRYSTYLRKLNASL